MEVIIIITSVLLVTGFALWLHDRFSGNKTQNAGADGNPQDEVGAGGSEGECCGMHITCERDSLLASVSKSIEYYDDEELDRFKGRGPEEYADDEIEEFRDVLLTLLPADIAGWGRSVQLRGIQLPAPIKDELLMIVAEARREANMNMSEQK